MVAKAAGISLRSEQRDARAPAPTGRVRLVLAVDENSQIRALDRTAELADAAGCRNDDARLQAQPHDPAAQLQTSSNTL
jgi:hypothetical protein